MARVDLPGPREHLLQHGNKVTPSPSICPDLGLGPSGCGLCGVLDWRMGTVGWAGKDQWGVLGPDSCKQADSVREELLKNVTREVSGPG